MKRYISFLVTIFLLASCTLLYADSSFTVNSLKGSFTVSPVVEGLEFPWGLSFLPDGTGMLVTERTGRLLLVRGGRTVPVSGVPQASVTGQGGLLDVALSPDFERDSLVYLSFAEEEGGRFGTAVARGRLVISADGSAGLEGTRVIYRALPKTTGGNHFGSRLAFDGKGFLYVTLGERGSMNRAQDTADPYGSVLRLNSDGSIPQDNPFASRGGSPGGGAPEIFSYGHRNPQGMARHPVTGDIWTHEHGPKGGDEVNILKIGANYGWPRVTYGVNYSGSTISSQTRAEGIEDPVVYWIPSIAPSGMAFYTGGAFPGWNGNLFVGALAGKHLRRLELRGNEVIGQEVLLLDRLGRIRDVRTGPDGLLYLLTDSEKGGIYRIEPAE
jgi:glucose/arabinose dehydrogenase